MSDNKQISVDEAKDILMDRILDLYDGGHPYSQFTYYAPHIDNLIAAVRAECKAVNPCERKCIDFCNAYEQGRSAVRAETLAEFRKLAEKYQRIEDTLRTGEIHPEACNVIKNIMADMSRLIHPLETSNQKP